MTFIIILAIIVILIVVILIQRKKKMNDLPDGEHFVDDENFEEILPPEIDDEDDITTW